jgi:dinuclear metal center YbgI/SA1388 family protein
VAALADIVGYLDAELRTALVPDYDAALNGLQLANGGTVSRVAAAVDFSLEVARQAVAERSNLLIVHHGMFWRGNHAFTGVAFERLRAAIAGDLAVYSSHIPLDLHPRFGNNVLLAKELGLTPDGTFGAFRDTSIGVTGVCDMATSEIVERAARFAAPFATTVVATRHAPDRCTRRWAVVTGAGASDTFLAEAHARGVDTLIVGEGTHHSAVSAMEHGLAIIYAGHYATETLGVRAIVQEVSSRFATSSTFVSAPTGL